MTNEKKTVLAVKLLELLETMGASVLGADAILSEARRILAQQKIQLSQSKSNDVAD